MALYDVDADLDDNYRRLMPNADGTHQPTAMEQLNDWILRDPSFRVVDRMARIGGLCSVTLRGKRGKYTSETQLTFDGAVRTALMIAGLEGDK
jgi:hypothetical protein